MRNRRQWPLSASLAGIAVLGGLLAIGAAILRPEKIRTVIPSSFEDYLACGYDSPGERAAETSERQAILERFPYSVMLQVAYPEMDYANRWCWQNLGPVDGLCTQKFSDYPVCEHGESHSHVGRWTTHWFVKTDYDFGFNEWYFEDKASHDRFCAIIPQIHWGEGYPKTAGIKRK